jgi:hypothetical protein
MLRYKQPEVISGSIVRFGVRSNLLQEKGDFTMLSLKRCLLITLIALCTLTASLVVAPGVTHAQTTSQQAAHAGQTAQQPMKPKVKIKSYWDGTLVTLNLMDMRLLAAGSYSLFWILSAIPGAGKLLNASLGGTGLTAYDAADAYIHNQCFWFWVSTYDPAWGKYSCH